MSVKINSNINKLIRNLAIQTGLEKSGVYLEGQIKRTITKNRKEWPPLKPQTIKKKRSSKMLIDTGRLRASITHDIIGNRIKIGAFGEKAIIAAVHELGAPSINVPERSYLRSTLIDEKEKIIKLFLKEYNKVIAQSAIK